MNKREIKMEEVKKSDKKLFRKFCRNFNEKFEKLLAAQPERPFEP